MKPATDTTRLPGRIEAVVIGASAGGVEALTHLLPALHRDVAAAFFVVLHLPRTRPSLLADIFQTRCALPVSEAMDKQEVVVGHVYVAPPDYHLLLDPGPQLSLSVDAPVNFSRPSIDVLFESAADLYAERLAGVLLTGGNDDGAAGMAAIRGRGGVTVVQDPRDAQMPLMPESALRLGPADHVMPLDGIAGLLASLRRTGSS
ncbi:MAG: chemotaxis protein CheB [Pseudomonadota bacterium]|nr:chemotaxis protein CheB [Pseudomonadota bacterium]